MIVQEKNQKGDYTWQEEDEDSEEEEALEDLEEE